MKLKRTTAILTAGLMLAGTPHSFPTASVPAAAVSPAPAAETTAVTTTATTAKTTASTTATTAKTTASTTATTAKTTASATATTAKTTASATATTAKTTASTTATTAKTTASTSATATLSTTLSFTAEGKLGKSAAWQLNSDGHLLITGSGDLSDADLTFNPHAESIKTVEFRNTDANSVLTAVAPSMFGKCKNLTSVKLPDTIKTIGKSAFYGCSALAEINFPSALETIESQAFRETALTEIVLPGCSLGDTAFYNCPNLKTVTIKEGTPIIPVECFRYCAALEDVYLPDSVTDIQCGSSSESGAFANCPLLQTVSIGKSIEKIDNRAFRTEGQGNLTVTFREGAAIVPDSAFTGRTELAKVVLPKSLKTIGKSAFSGCANLAEINFPDAVESIGAHAFRETALTGIELPGCTLGENAFYNCTKLKTVKINEGTPIIPVECFRYCAALEDVYLPDSVTDIQCGYSSESGAFANCPVLQNVSIGKGIEKIHSRAFRTEGEGNLTVTFREGAEIVPDSAFTGRTELAKVVLPKSLKTIGSSAFSGCKNLADCRLTSGIQSIGKEAFKETALIEVEIPGCELGEAAFYNCTALTGVTIEEDMKIIPAEAFRYCAALEDVYLPDSVTEIQCGYSSESGAFANCPALQTVSIGKSIEKIDNRAFRTTGEGNLTVTFREGASIVPDSAFAGRTELAKVILPESMKTIGNKAFSGCKNLAECNFPDALEAIGEQAFRETALTGIELPGCTLGAVAFYNCPKLKTVTIKEGTPTIPNECFRYCAALTDVTLPDSVTEIQCGYSSESGAFADCPALQNVSIGKSIEKIDNRAFRTEGEGNLTVTFREGAEIVPDSAFTGRTELAKVILPESMKTIGSKAFSGCANLAECNLPDALEGIGEQAFRETALTAVSIPGCTLGAAAFYNCQSLAIVTIGEGTAVIPTECFRYCTALTDVYLPDSVTEMQCGYSSESGALANCPSLTNVSVGKGIQTINPKALRTESEALTVTFRDGVTAIPANALDSGFVKKVILPETVTEIDEKAIPANVVICAPEKSAAQTFAETKERNFEAMAAAYYDLNGDGKLTAADAELLVQILSETLPAGAKMPDAAHLAAADCDQDGLLTMADVRMLLDMAAPEA